MSSYIQDKGYACFVAVAIALGACFGSGVTYGSLSLLVHIWIIDLGITEQEAGWISSITSVIHLPCPIYSFLIHAIGGWKSQLAVTLLVLFGYIIISFATVLWHLIIGFALFLGMGSAGALVSGTVIIEDYFNIYKDRAWAILMSAYFFGLVIGGPVLGFLVELFDYRTALLIEAATFTAVNLLVTILYAGRHVWVCCPQKIMNGEINGTEKDHQNQSPVNPSKGQQRTLTDTETSPLLDRSTPDSFKQRLTKSLKQQRIILCDPSFISLVIYSILVTIPEVVWLTYVIELAVQAGYATSQEAVFGTTINGITSLIVSLTIAISSKYNKDPVLICIFFTLFASVSVACIPIVTYLPVYYVLNGLAGIGSSGIYSSRMLNIIELFGESEIVAHRMSYLFLATGLGHTIGALVVGGPIKITGSIDIAFYIGGGSAFLSVFFILNVWVKHRIKRNRDTKDEPSILINLRVHSDICI